MTVESWVLWVYSREQSREPAGNGSKTRRGKEGGRKGEGPRFTIRHRSSAKHTASFPTLIMFIMHDAERIRIGTPIH